MQGYGKVPVKEIHLQTPTETLSADEEMAASAVRLSF